MFPSINQDSELNKQYKEHQSLSKMGHFEKQLIQLAIDVLEATHLLSFSSLSLNPFSQFR